MPDAHRTGTPPDPPDALRLAPLADAGADLDRLLDGARLAFDVRVASIRLLEGGARLASRSGPAFSPAGRETAFCRRAIEAGRPLVVTDASLDARFRADRLVSGGAGIRFYAGAPLQLHLERPIGTLCLLDDRPRDLAPEAASALTEALARLANEAAAVLQRKRDAALIARMRAELAAQEALIREQAAALAHSRKIFERASAAARIGVWECSLPDETLFWTDSVYDMFDMPRGAALDRGRTLGLYSEPSRRTLEAIRSKAIAERGGFHLDAEITTEKGNRRWIRLTASVECEDGRPVRIFGMKQDITEEKLLADRTRYLAEFDVMTGLANRGRFQARLSGEDGRQEPIGALLLIDLDGFKQVNDSFGHAAGDECLTEAAARLSAICGASQLVARIGGDEFAVLLGPGIALSVVEALAGRIVEALRRPVEGSRSYAIGASVGIALADSSEPCDLFARADAALYAAKAAGRNTFRTFEPGMIQAAA